MNCAIFVTEDWSPQTTYCREVPLALTVLLMCLSDAADDVIRFQSWSKAQSACTQLTSGVIELFTHYQNNKVESFPF